MPETLTIVSGDRGRSFTVTLLGLITADRLWDMGRGYTCVPAYLSFVESHDTVKAFKANLASGHAAEIRDDHGRLMTRSLETPGAARLQWRLTRIKEHGVTIATAYAPALCDLDPPEFSPDRVRFVFAPPRWWVDEQIASDRLAEYPGGERRELAVAAMFAGFVDRRSPMPPIQDPEFHRRVYRAAQARPWFGVPAERPAPGTLVWAMPMPPHGLETVAAVDVSHEEFEAFYRDQLARYFAEVRPGWLEDRPHKKQGGNGDDQGTMEQGKPVHDERGVSVLVDGLLGSWSAPPAHRHALVSAGDPEQGSLFDW